MVCMQCLALLVAALVWGAHVVGADLSVTGTVLIGQIIEIHVIYHLLPFYRLFVLLRRHRCPHRQLSFVYRLFVQ